MQYRNIFVHSKNKFGVVYVVTSKCFLIDGPGKCRIEEIELPEPGSDDVLIRVRASGICTTDRRIFSGAIKVPTPVIGGHEIAGEIVEVGSGIKDLHPGDRVAVDSINRCGSCYYCRKGHDNLCINSRKQNKIGPAFLIAGGFSEYAISDRRKIFVSENATEYTELAMSEPLACCINSIKKTSLSLGDSVLVVGGGTMGLLHAQLLKSAGVSVVVSDPSEERRIMAEESGIVGIIPEEIEKIASVVNSGNGFDAAFLTAPAISTLDSAMASLRKGATLVLYSSLHPDNALDLEWNRLHYAELRLVGTEGRKASDFHEAVSLISSGLVKLDDVVTKEISLSELEDELVRSPSGSDQRTVVTF